MAIVAAVQQAELNAAVITPKAFKAFTFAVHTAALVLAVVGTFRFDAVGAFPSGFTGAAAGFSAPVPTAITVGLYGHFTWRRAPKGKSIFKINT